MRYKFLEKLQKYISTPNNSLIMSQYIHNRGKHVTSELHSLCQHHGKYNRGNEKHGGGQQERAYSQKQKKNSFPGYLEEDLEITVLCHKHQQGMAVYRHGYVYTPVAYVWCMVFMPETGRYLPLLNVPHEIYMVCLLNSY